MGATITIPEGKGPFPAALLITGSGPQNRDEEIMGHKTFAVLADHLTRKGFIVLRVDDRGVGKSTGNFANATSADFANDVSSGIDYLLTRPEVNKKKIGLIGHSEGGMIAPMLATQRKDIDFIVLLAGPGVKIIDLMTEQNAAVLRSVNMSKEAIEAYLPFYKEAISQIISAPDTATAYKAADALLKKWIAKTNEEIVTQLGMKDRSAQQSKLSTLSKQLSTPWFKYFLTFDPQPYLQKLQCKVLAINGGKDIQVIASQNLPGIETSLKKSKSKVYDIKELSGLNHLFQTCHKCTLQEYGELEETFSPVALQLVGDWMIKNVK
jgi:pimeloyl-ACP methyl ester carboxylesterase